MICVPGLTHSLIKTGSRAAETTAMRSASATASSTDEAATAPLAAQNSSSLARVGLHAVIRSKENKCLNASTWLCACTPEPITARRLESGRANKRAETADTAEVRASVK